MIDYFIRYHDRLLTALAEHLMLVMICLPVSLVLAALLTVAGAFFPPLQKAMVNLFSIIYAIPSLAMFAMLIPLTGLGTGTALIVLIVYNQYILLRNFFAGLNGVDSAVMEAAAGMGMTKMQKLVKIQLPLSKRSLMTGIRLAVVSTIGIATIAASINAGGLGTVLFDGLRTMNVYKILWGSLLSAGLAVAANSLLGLADRRPGKKSAEALK